MKKIMKAMIRVIVLLSIIIGIGGCSGMEDIYKEYIVYGGHIYPQKPTDPRGYSGDGRVVLKWKKGVDSSIKKAIVSWDDGRQKREFNIEGNSDNVELVVDNLEERDYSFVINTYDTNGNKSVPVEVNSRAYGDIYKSSLFNRTINIAYMDVDKLVVEWNEADLTSNITKTEFCYINKENKETKVVVDAQSNEALVLNDYKMDTEFSFQSSFVPDTTCVDVFESVLEVSKPLTIINRSDWTITASSYEPNGQTGYGGANPERLLDGLIENTPNAGLVPTYWHSRHSGSDVPGYPHWLAVDMKKKVNIRRVVLQCRNDPNCRTGYSFSNFTIQGSNDGENWTDLETYDIYSRSDTAPQYYPVDTKENFSYFKVVMNKSYDNSPYAHLAELSILGEERE
ncbi:DUF4998 domain-containing protein [Bacteroides sp.]|uniref:DUF4998 domain-containing protein n=1 Tax=Bacteroides sp. TaxID=29523 RepID=UPI002639003E|nr:DUF4998 domain-containing protein [Bacteroides sp.]MDD3038568.1 DUF4998 domain-containing protein [Bacteroides sp.]